jgi:hypothetical protein
MIKLKPLVLVTAALFACMACEPAANTNSTNANAGNRAAANANAAKPAPVAPSKDALFALEKQAWEGWKNRDAKGFEAVMSDKYVGFASTGRIGKTESIKTLSDQKCEIKSYSFSDEQMHPVGPDVAILTFKAAQDGTCDGKPIPAAVWSASVYAREGDTWKTVYYSEAPVVDPKAPPAKPSSPTAAKPAAPPDTAKPDSQTDALLALEKTGWEAWKNKDQKAFESTLGSDFHWLSGEGRWDRSTTIAKWTTENTCNVKSYELTDAKSVALSPDVSLLTFRGGADGDCGGQPLTTNWYGTVYQKTGDAWKPVFGTMLP